MNSEKGPKNPLFLHIQGPPLGCDNLTAGFSEENALCPPDFAPEAYKTGSVWPISLPTASLTQRARLSCSLRRATEGYRS